MPSTSDVILAGGGADVFMQLDGNFFSRASDSTALTASNLNNAVPDIFKSTARFVKERLPDGSANGDFYNVRISKGSYPFYFTGGTVRSTDSGYNIMAVLAPGARGVLTWDEDNGRWDYEGTGQMWWPCVENINTAWQSFDFNTWPASMNASPVDDALIIGYAAASPDTDDLAVQAIPFGSDGQVKTFGTAAIRPPPTNATSKVRIFMISQTIGIAVYNQTTANNTLMVPFTRSGDSITLGITSTLISGTDQADSIEIVGTRANATSFTMVHTDHVVDATYYPEFAYCTLSGSGATLTITRNTGTDLGGGANSALAHNMCEDPQNNEYYWTGNLDEDGGTNTQTPMTIFQRSGTSYTVITQGVPTIVGTGHTAVYPNRLDKLITNSGSQTFASSASQVQSLGRINSRNATITQGKSNATNFIVAGGVCGGIWSLPNGTGEGQTTTRLSRILVEGSIPFNPEPSYSSRNVDSSLNNIHEIDSNQSDQNIVGLLPDITGAAATPIDKVFWIASEFGAADNEGHGQIYVFMTSGNTDKQATCIRLQIPWGTRWKDI